MIESKQLEDALKRIALTADGRLFHLMLQRSLMATCPDPNIPGALPLHEGQRRFAAHLKALMDSAIAENTTGDLSSDTPSERPIVVAAASGNAGTRTRSRGAGRRGGYTSGSDTAGK